MQEWGQFARWGRFAKGGYESQRAGSKRKGKVEVGSKRKRTAEAVLCDQILTPYERVLSE